MQIPGYATIPVAARALNLKPDTVRRYCNRGMLKAQRIGWTLLISQAELDRFKRERKPRGRPKKGADE
jgi:excisionase family DNA binding protein